MICFVPGAGVSQWQVAMENIASRLTDFNDSKKGKYNLLAAILPHTGANYLLDLLPNLVSRVFEAFHDPAISRAASQFLKVLLVDLLKEYNKNHTGAAVELNTASSQIPRLSLISHGLFLYMMSNSVIVSMSIFHMPCSIAALLSKNVFKVLCYIGTCMICRQ